MVPIWSSATVAGLPLEQWPGFDADVQKECFEDTKTAGAQVIKLKGGSAFAVGLAIREVVHALALDSRKVLPVSTLRHGRVRNSDVCLSVPTVIGCGGVRQHVELALRRRNGWGLGNSARVLRETFSALRSDCRRRRSRPRRLLRRILFARFRGQRGKRRTEVTAHV